MKYSLCPLCNSNIIALLHILKLDNKANYIYKCLNCEIIYLKKRTQNNTNLYQDDYYYFSDYDKLYTLQDIKKFKFILKYIKKKYDNLRTLLDIGAANGLLLKTADEFGFIPEGIEISKSGSKYISEKLDYTVYNSDFIEANIKKKYDIITMLDMLEHSQNPIKVIQKSYSLLEQNGILIIEIPNIESIFYKMIGRRWVGFNKYHNFFFTKNKIVSLLKNNGFIIQDIFTKNIGFFSREGLWRLGVQDFILKNILKRKKSNKKNRTVIDGIKEIELKFQTNNEFQVLNIVKKMIKIINWPTDYIFNKFLLGDQLWVIAQKK